MFMSYNPFVHFYVTDEYSMKLANMQQILDGVAFPVIQRLIPVLKHSLAQWKSSFRRLQLFVQGALVIGIHKWAPSPSLPGIDSLILD
jgi:hypothetical protein